MDAINRFYVVTVVVETEDEKGKIKKVKETHLVDAKDPTDVQKKVISMMDGTMFDWDIQSIQLSKISVVYGDCVKE